jgi:hypothetical protein
MAGRGGFQGGEGSIAYLRDHGFRGFAHCPQCARDKCRQPAMKPSKFCKLHGGSVAKRKLSPFRQRVVDARRQIRAASRAGLIPAELLVQTAWVTCHHVRLCHLRPRLLAAWLSVDPAAWSRTLREIDDAIAALPFTLKARK